MTTRRARPGRRGPQDETPTVFAADEQLERPVDLDRWAELARRVLEAEGVDGDAELSVLFVDEPTISGLNRRFMATSGPTDVLSFPIDGEVEPQLSAGMRDGGPGRSPMEADDVPLLLGDVVICPEVAHRQATSHAGEYDDELALLLVHGILHLLGLDHTVAAERDAMQARERDLLARFHGPLGRDPWVD